jgi:pyruvate ferredoxin oxidoreductase delta subunit
MKRAKDIHETIAWQDMTAGCEIYEGGTSSLTQTGEWRVSSPKWLREKCKQCMLCVPYCPDSSIPVGEGKRKDFDFDHCKGCGICAKVCPFGAIAFEEG